MFAINCRPEDRTEGDLEIISSNLKVGGICAGIWIVVCILRTGRLD